MIRHRLATLLLAAACAAAGPALAQPAGPTRDGGPIAPPPERQQRFELGLHYGLAAFTFGHADVMWLPGARTSADMDLATTPTFGGLFAWGLGRQTRLILTATSQSTMIEAYGAGDLAAGEPADWRTDLDLLHVQLGLEWSWRRGDVQPYLTASGGGMLARAPDLDQETWFYSAMPGLGVRFQVQRHVTMRVQFRAPILFVDGQVIWQLEPGVGLAWAF